MRRFILAFLVLACARPAAGLSPNFSYTKLVDTQTIVPGRAVPFVAFDSPPSISNDVVVFVGRWANSGNWIRGVYEWSNGSLSIVADPNTSIPGQGTKKFGNFGTAAFIENGTIAFLGYDPATYTGNGGIYRVAGGQYTLIAGSGTPVPGGSGTFLAPWMFQSPVLDNGAVAFGYRYGNSPFGIYTDQPGSLVRVMDQSIPVPGGSGNFTSPQFLGPYQQALEGGVLHFFGGDSLGVQGLFRWNSGVIEPIVNTATTYSWGRLTGGFFCIDGGPERLVFTAEYRTPSNAARPGCLFQVEGDSLSLFLGSGDPVPGIPRPLGQITWAARQGPVTIVEATSFSLSCVDPRNCPPGSNQLLYCGDSGIESIIANKDTLDGKPVKAASIRPGGISGSRMAVQVVFHDNSQALYLVSRLSEPVPVQAGTVINIDAQVHGDAPLLERLRVRIPAGAWTLRRVNPAMEAGARYYAWTPSMASQSWRTLFRVRSADGTLDAGCGYDASAVPDPGTCDDSPENAWACTEVQKPECFLFGPFSLATEQIVEFWIGDHVVSDNGGGVSLLLEPYTSRVADDAAAPAAELRAPFPNPTPGRVTMSLDVRRPGRLEFLVADMAGRPVWRRDIGVVDSGSLTLTWEGMDPEGAPLPAGIYFCLVRLDGSPLASQRIVLTR